MTKPIVDLGRAIPEHEHQHSLYALCLDCKMFGIPMPFKFNQVVPCGNCRSVETARYFPSCCIVADRKAEVERLRVAVEALDCRELRDCGEEGNLCVNCEALSRIKAILCPAPEGEQSKSEMKRIRVQQGLPMYPEGEGFTKKDLSGFSVKLSTRGETWDGCNGSDELLRDLNTKLRALRAKDKTEIERLSRGIACLKGHDLVGYLGCGHCFDRLEKENTALRSQSEALREQANRIGADYTRLYMETFALKTEIARLTHEREEAPMVYGRFDFGHVTMPFGSVRAQGDTHTARLVDVKEIEK